MLMMHWSVYAPYKRKLKHEEAIRMIANGECGVFPKKTIAVLYSSGNAEGMDKKGRQLKKMKICFQEEFV